MRTWHRFTLAAIASSLGLALACGGQTSGVGGGGGGSSGAGPSACDDYFQTVFASNCEGLVPPPSELSRIQSRFDQLCAAALALPGVSITATALETCVSTIKSSGCSSFDRSNGVCAFDVGSLGTGSSCFTDDQCQSGNCTAGSAGPDGGQVVCGTCGAALAIGQPCTGGQSCGPNATCSFSGSSSTGTCAALTYGNLGAPCNETSSLCNSGLYCDTTKQQCSTPGGAGAPCNSDQACTSPLVCPFVTAGAATCQSPGAAGASCQSDEQCASGLGCDSGTQKCGAVSWVSAGQACSADVRCLVGSCPFDGTGQTGGTCPAVIPDGQPCSASDQTTTCDTFASCIGGTCLLGYPSCP
jgi:hypothetical protein